MTTNHDAALDGAVRNLAGNVLNAEQVIELACQYASAYHDHLDTGGESGAFAVRCDERFQAMCAAIRANVRPRP